MAVAHHNTTDSDHPGPRALEFIDWAVTHYGATSPTRPDRVLITASQAELVLAHPRVDSAGTVAYYVRKLRSSGVITSTRPIEVDRTLLDQHTHDTPTPEPPEPTTQASPAGSGTGGAAPAGETPTDLPGLLARHNELVATALSALAESLVVQNQIIATLAATPATVRDTRESANPAFAEPANIRGNREPQKEDRKGFDLRVIENPDLPDLPEVAEPANFAEPDSRNTPIPYPLVDQTLEPLRQWCADNGRPTRIDDRGRSVLAQLDPDALQAGVATICTEAAATPSIRNPIGLLIRRAQEHDRHTFASPIQRCDETLPGRGADTAARNLAATLIEQGDDPDDIERYLVSKGYAPSAAAQLAVDVTGSHA